MPKGAKELIDALNEDVSYELAAVIQYATYRACGRTGTSFSRRIRSAGTGSWLIATRSLSGVSSPQCQRKILDRSLTNNPGSRSLMFDRQRGRRAALQI